MTECLTVRMEFLTLLAEFLTLLAEFLTLLMKFLSLLTDIFRTLMEFRTRGYGRRWVQHCRPLRGLLLFWWDLPGAYAPGFMMTRAPRAQEVFSQILL